MEVFQYYVYALQIQYYMYPYCLIKRSIEEYVDPALNIYIDGHQDIFQSIDFFKKIRFFIQSKLNPPIYFYFEIKMLDHLGSSDLQERRGCDGRGKQGNREILIRYFVLLRGREMVMGSRSFALIVYFRYYLI